MRGGSIAAYHQRARQHRAGGRLHARHATRVIGWRRRNALMALRRSRRRQAT